MRLVVPSEPRGKGRPRFVRETGRTYTDTPTLRHEAKIREAWRAAGHKPIPSDIPLELTVSLVMARPANHTKTNGELGSVGLRVPMPMRKPDVDNVLKLCMDALNGMAYGDDVQVVDARVRRRWARRGEAPCTVIVLTIADEADPDDVLDPEWSYDR